MISRKLLQRLASAGTTLLMIRFASRLVWQGATFGSAGAVVAPGLGSERLSIPRSRGAEGTFSKLRSFADRYWAELLAAAIAIAATAWLVHVLSREALPPSGDSGQWLTISRYYLGESMPSDRSATVMPPIVPLILAGFSLLVAKPAAIVALAAVCYGAVSGLAFLLGRRLSGAAAGGLLAVLFVALAQRELFEVIAVGAYPQLVAIAGMAACLLALIDLSQAPLRGRSWTLLAAGVAVVVFSHTPSATVLFPPLAACLAYVVWSSEHPKQTAKAAVGALRPVVLLWAVFIAMNHDVIFGYANVPATFDLKGPDRMWNVVWHNDAQRMVFGGGALALVALPLFFRGGNSWKSRPAVVLTLWTGALITMVAFAALRHVNTDYPRFVAYFVIPMGVAAAAGIQACKPSRAVTLAIAAPLLLFASYESLGHLDAAARFYGVNSQSDELVDVANWLNQSGDEGAIIGGTRDTKWVQALTGRTSLLYLRRISITRPWEIDRAIAAEVIHRSNGAIESGQLLTSVNDGGQDFGAVHPAGVRIDAFHKGMYSPSVQIDDRSTRLTFESFGKTRTVPLASLAPGVTSTASSDGVYRLITRYVSTELGIEVVRIVSVRTNDPDALQLEYHVGAPPGIALTQISLKPGAWADEPVLIAPYSMPLSINAPLFDGETMPFETQSAWSPSAAAPDGANPFLPWQEVVVTMRALGNERRIDYPRLYDPLAVLDEYGVRYLIDRDGDGAAFPIIRSLGLTPVYANGEVAIYDVAR